MRVLFAQEGAPELPGWVIGSGITLLITAVTAATIKLYESWVKGRTVILDVVHKHKVEERTSTFTEFQELLRAMHKELDDERSESKQIKEYLVIALKDHAENTKNYNDLVLKQERIIHRLAVLEQEVRRITGRPTEPLNPEGPDA